MISSVLALGVVISLLAVLDILAAIFGVDSRPELGTTGDSILS